MNIQDLEKNTTERARDKQQVTQRLRELAGGYKFNFHHRAVNYSLVYFTYEKKWIPNNATCLFSPNEIYFPTKEAALAARDELGSRLNVLLEIEE